MLDIGWSELLLIGVVALIVVGPKDLPVMFRTLGRFTGKLRSMGREFQRAMDEAAKETGLNEAAKDLRDLTSKKKLGLDALEDAAAKFEKWDPVKKPAAPKGPATQALADRKAAEAEARAAARATKAEIAADAGLEPEPAAKPARAKAPAARTNGAKPAAAARPAAAPKPAATAKPARSAAPKAPAAKPARRKAPAAGKGDA